MEYPRLPFSEAYTSWIETRVKRHIEDRETQDAVKTAADRLEMQQNANRAPEVLTRITKRSGELQSLRNNLNQHLQCVESAKQGKLCDVDVLTVDETAEATHDEEAYVWIPQGSNAIIQQGSDTDGVADAGPTPSTASSVTAGACGSTPLGEVRLEVWCEEWVEIPNEAGGAVDVENEREKVISLKHPSRGWADLNVLDCVKQSLVQDQVRMWMAHIRRGRGLLNNASTTNLPPELFRLISVFLDPFADVLKAPTYYAALAIRRRYRDLEKLLDTGLQYTLDRLAEDPDDNIEGNILWRIVKNDPSEVLVGIRFGSVRFSMSGELPWPNLCEKDIVNCRAWNARRSVELASTEKPKFVRLPSKQVYFSSIALVLAEFFRRKGLKFSQSDDNRQDFTISWGASITPAAAS
ncbi:unnamed protein product [Amoebophrya sp. A120]|nr:unnamed protein product [Amoebophrya sp. A120]|eukprot:GSA120T00003153001.1